MFLELMFKFWIFSLNECADKDNQINFVNYKFAFQRFGKKYNKCRCKKKDII